MTEQAFKRAKHIEEDIKQLEKLVADMTTGERWYVTIQPTNPLSGSESLFHTLNPRVASALTSAMLNRIKELKEEFNSL